MAISAFNPWIYMIGWILAHFLWQGVITGLVLAVLLTFLRHKSANTRYIVSCITFFSMLLFPLLTFLFLISDHSGSTPFSTTFTPPVNNPAVLSDNASITASSISSNDGEDVNQPATPISEQEALQAIWNHFCFRIKPYLPSFVLIWIVGIFILSGWRLLGWIGLHRLKKHHVAPILLDLQDRFTILIHKLGISKSVKILESSLADIPLTIGFFKPVILIPSSVLSGLSPEHLEAIIAHELAHIRRHDYLINLFQTIVETIFFYHPVVWWISNRIRIERERCCDEIASKTCKSVLSYVQALAKLEDMRMYFSQLAMAANAGNTLNRIRYMLQIPSSPKRNSSILIASTVCFFSVLFFVVFVQQPALSIYDPAFGVFDHAINIGFVSTPGVVKYNPWKDEYHIEGQGRRMIGEKQDELFYVYKKMEGDWCIEATLRWAGSFSEFDRIGLMCRESLDENAKFASTSYLNKQKETCILGSNRSNTSEFTINQSSDSRWTLLQNEPIRCRLTRLCDENLFLHERYDPYVGQWFRISSSHVEMPRSVFVGLYASSNSRNQESRADGIIQDLIITNPLRTSVKSSANENTYQTNVFNMLPLRAVRLFPELMYTPNKPVKITIQLKGQPGVIDIRERPPKGWEIKDISSNGILINGEIFWKQISVPEITSLTYTVIPPDYSNGNAIFAGYFGEEAIHGMTKLVIPKPIGIFENHMDFGFPLAPGNATYNPDTAEYQIEGFKGESDLAFHCTYQKMRGDFRIASRLRSKKTAANDPFAGFGMFVGDKLGYINKYLLIQQSLQNKKTITVWRMKDERSEWEEGAIIPSSALDKQLEIIRQGNLLSVFSIDPSNGKRILHDRREMILEDPVYTGLFAQTKDIDMPATGFFTEVELESLDESFVLNEKQR